MPRCPGQDLRYWTPKDIFEVKCESCGREIEFWRDEPMRTCPGCSREVRNPRMDPSCADWCKYAQECLGSAGENDATVAPLIDRLGFALEGYFATDLAASRSARRFLDRAQKLVLAKKVDPCVVQAAALLVGGLVGKKDEGEEEFMVLRALLERAGLQPGTAQRICELVRTVLAGGCDESPEGRVLAELMKVE